MTRKIYHVSLIESFGGRNNYFFTSQAAIYEVLPKEVVGITYKALTRALNKTQIYANKKCIIKKDIAYGVSRGKE